jgi:FixJ family two-component response regulator
MQRRAKQLGSWVAVVDDDASVRTALARLLRSAELPVKTFASAREFLAEYADHPPDCLVLDVHLGEMSGLELYDYLASYAPVMPVIFITAHDEVLASELTRRAGPHGYLRKPFDGDALLALVRRAMLHAEDSR